MKVNDRDQGEALRKVFCRRSSVFRVVGNPEAIPWTHDPGLLPEFPQNGVLG